MVSPCKRKKTEKKGKAPGNVQNSVSSGSSKKSKPLTNKKFYLDLRNSSTLKKIEDKISSLGGTIELFLVRDVDYVVTDRKSVSISPSSTPSPADSPSDVSRAANRTRSRGEAMLERVKLQTLRTSCDILEKAASWKIPVYSIQRFLVWLEKISKKAERGASRSGLRELRGSFVKVETGVRPEFKVFHGGWPKLNLNRGGPAFANHETGLNNNRMTRKSGSKLLVGGGGKDGSSSSGGGGAGYCEVCRVSYGYLEEHVASVGHIKAVTDPNQYQELESLAHSLHGLRKSLRIAKSPPPVVSPARQLSPPPPTVLQCNGHQSPTHQGLANGVGGRKHSKVKEENRGHNLRSRLASPPSRRRVSKKRLSVEEKLIEDNKSYYKVEVLNSKLRSTGCLQKQLEIKEEPGMGGVVGSLVNGGGDDHVEEPVVVRFKKVRKTELSVLSDEAENFMFGTPEKKEDENQEPVVEEGGRKKRRSHTDSTINENNDYYKVELTGSRLRCQASTPSQVPNKTEVEQREESGETSDDDDEDDVKPLNVMYSFEMEDSGPWAALRKRQNECNEEWLPMYHKYPKWVLPSELPYQERLRLLSRRRRRLSRCLDDKPRKSPRCHASTLAIMSSLIPRSSRLIDPPPNYDEDTTTSSLTVESSSNSDSQLHEPCSLYPQMMQFILSAFEQEEKPKQDPPKSRSPRKVEAELRARNCPIDYNVFCDPDPKFCIPPIDTPVDIIPIVNNYEQCNSMEVCAYESRQLPRSFDHHYFDQSCNSSDCSDVFGFSEDGRTFLSRRRKRKKRNLTGWPIEKPRKKLLTYMKKYNRVKSEGGLLNGSVDAQPEVSMAPHFTGVLNPQSSSDGVSPIKRRPGRPRLYPPGMAPSIRKQLLKSLSPHKMHRSPRIRIPIN